VRLVVLTFRILLAFSGRIGTKSATLTLAYVATRLSGRSQPLEALAVLHLAFWFGWAVLCLPLAALVVASTLHIALLTTAQTAVWWLSPDLREGMKLPAWWDQWLNTSLMPIRPQTPCRPHSATGPHLR